MIPRLGLFAALISLTAITSAARADVIIFSDDFSGGTLSNWTTGAKGGGTAPVTSGGKAVITAGPTAKAVSVMRSTATDFNPFDQAYTVTLSGITLDGEPGAGGSKPIAYLMVGRSYSQSSGGNSAATNYVAGETSSVTAGDSSGNVYIQILERTSNTFSLRVGEIVGSSTPVAPINSSEVSLSGPPTALTLTLSANPSNLLTWSITLTGATFGNGLATMSGTFTSAITSTALANSYLTLGQQNNAGSGDIGSNNTFSLDSVTVIAVPEPNTTALLFGGGLVLAGLAHYRAKSL